MASRLVVSAPASSANLGPGYDCLGVALPLRLTVAIERRAGPLSVTLSGAGAEMLPRDRSNLVIACMSSICGDVDGLAIEIENGVPLKAGAGSSSAAIVAGLAAGALLAGEALDLDTLLARAVPYEGHPDNAAAAIHGGITIAMDGTEPLARRIEPPPGLALILAVPAEELCTKESRAALRVEVPRADAVHNVQHVAMLVHALATGDLELLPRALSDRLHEPDRAPLAPLYTKRVGADLGALGVTLSGAGPSVLVWARADEAGGVAARVEAVAAGARIHRLLPDPVGVVAEECQALSATTS